MPVDGHGQGFAAATAALPADINAYLDREHADPTADGVSHMLVVGVGPCPDLQRETGG
jgi:hypothetical protein